MSENGYLISDAAKQVEVESHVLRYWEEELKMEIPRNEMGHRYYTEEHIQRFRKIKDLKDKGYQLKAIKAVISGEDAEEPSEMTLEPALPVSSSISMASADRKMEQFHTIMTDIISQALERNSETLSQDIAGRVGEKVIKEMNYIVRVEEEKQEERFKKMDELLRVTQKNSKMRKEAAATIAPVVKLKKKKQGFLKFRKKNK